MMKDEWQTFLCALQFLTRIPVRGEIDYSEARLNQSVGYYPAVGALIGLLVYLSYWLTASFLPTQIAVVLSISFSLMLTGALHEDGFADMCDGIGGGQTKARSLEIMRDSRLGTYGVAGLVMMLLLKAALLVALGDISTSNLTLAAIFILSHGLSRSSAVAVIATSQYVRFEGAAKPVASGLDRHSRNIAFATSAVLLILFCSLTTWTLGIYAMAFGALGHIGARKVFEKKLGGYTGDCLGAVQQLTEISFLLGICVWLYSF